VSEEKPLSIVRRNLLTKPNYSPYCGKPSNFVVLRASGIPDLMLSLLNNIKRKERRSKLVKLEDYLTPEEIVKYNANVKAQAEGHDRRSPEECEDFEELMIWAFTWLDTPEGDRYWRDIHIRDAFVKLEYFTGEKWVSAGGAFVNETLAWISLGMDERNYRTVQAGKVLTDKSK